MRISRITPQNSFASWHSDLRGQLWEENVLIFQRKKERNAKNNQPTNQLINQPNKQTTTNKQNPLQTLKTFPK